MLAGAPAIQGTTDRFASVCWRRIRCNNRRATLSAGTMASMDIYLHAGPVKRDLDFSDRAPIFRLARKTGGFVIGEYSNRPILRQPTIDMAKPFRDSKGKIAGVVVVGLSLNWLGQQALRSRPACRARSSGSLRPEWHIPGPPARRRALCFGLAAASGRRPLPPQQQPDRHLPQCKACIQGPRSSWPYSPSAPKRKASASASAWTGEMDLRRGDEATSLGACC